MALKIGVLSQKGGVGKSTLVRALSTEYARNDWSVKIADMDLKQKTTTEWNCTRMESNLEPAIAVEPFAKVSDVLKQDGQYDLLLFDGAGQADEQTLQIAKSSDLIILPSGITRDDLVPQIKLAHEMRKKGVDKIRIGMCLSRVGASQAELTLAKEFIEEAGYVYLGYIPEKTSIGQAHDIGQSANETRFASITKMVDVLVQNIGDMLTKIEETHGEIA